MYCLAKRFDFLSSVEHKRRYFEECWYQTTRLVTTVCLPLYGHLSKYHLLCSTEESHIGLEQNEGE